jgi:hypothetical protein
MKSKKQPPKVNIKGVIHVNDGQSVRYYLTDGMATEMIKCCDCGLVHIEEFTPYKKFIQVRSWRDEETTKRERAKKRSRTHRKAV